MKTRKEASEALSEARQNRKQAENELDLIRYEIDAFLWSNYATPKDFEWSIPQLLLKLEIYKRSLVRLEEAEKEFVAALRNK